MFYPETLLFIRIFRFFRGKSRHYVAIKKDAPFSKVQRLLSEIYNDDFDFTILGEVTESIGAKVLEALGDKRFCNKGGASCGK